MPHLVILYTPNLERDTDMTALCRALADTMVGFRDDAGRVLELKTYETRSMHKGSIREKGYWDAAACFSFGCSALEWLLEQLAKLDVAAASRCILRYEPSAAALQLLLVEDAIEQGSDEQVSKRP
jgi:hypothetical protein